MMEERSNLDKEHATTTMWMMIAGDDDAAKARYRDVLVAAIHEGLLPELPRTVEEIMPSFDSLWKDLTISKVDWMRIYEML